MAVELGAGWLLVFSCKFSLSLNSLTNIDVITFCFFTFIENISSYLYWPSVSSSVSKLLTRTLHRKICCWLSTSVLHREHKGLLFRYFCLKLALQSVERDLRAWSWFTSSLAKSGLSMYFCIWRPEYWIWLTFEWVSFLQIFESCRLDFLFDKLFVWLCICIFDCYIILLFINEFEVICNEFNKVSTCWVSFLFIVDPFGQLSFSFLVYSGDSSVFCCLWWT